MSDEIFELANKVDSLRRCVIELSKTVRAIVDCEPDVTVIGRLDAIDHVLRTLPL